MIGRLLSRSLAPLARRATFPTSRRLRNSSTRVGGLLRTDSALQFGRQQSWPLGASFIHNVPAVRNISFARIIPKLFVKLVRVPAMFGGAMIAGVAYLQYQANRMCPNFTKQIYH